MSITIAAANMPNNEKIKEIILKALVNPCLPVYPSFFAALLITKATIDKAKTHKQRMIKTILTIPNAVI